MAQRQTRVLVDTSVLINLLRRRGPVVEQFRNLLLSGAELTTSAVNVAELFAGVRPGEELATSELLSGLNCFPLTPEVARRAGEITASRRRAGRTHTLDDMMIAATAQEFGCALWTDNRRDFEIPGLEVLPE
jgi:hypothetical protein